MLNAQEILRIIPHRYPFLLVDRVLEMEVGKRVLAVKNVSVDEWFFQGHFPSFPIMPGVLIVEALAQAGAVCLLSDQSIKGQIPLFAGINDCRFRAQVQPGDVLRLEVEFIAFRRPIGKGRGRAFVGDKLACECEMMFALVPTPDNGP